MANKILPVADALKQLYEALGGDDPEVLELSTNTELIQEIAKVASSGGSGLPEVSDVDEGKVLTVDSSGEWAAEMPSGGVSGKCTPRYVNDNFVGLEESPNDINDIRTLGVIPFYETLEAGDYYTYYLIACMPDDYNYTFAGVNPSTAVVSPVVFIAEDADSPLNLD